MRKNQYKKDYLNSYHELIQEHDRQLELALYWKDRAYSLGSPNMDITGSKSTGNKKDPLIEYVTNHRECCKLARKAKLMKEQIEACISELKEPKQRMVLRLRYFDRKTFDEISKEMNYSFKQISRIHGRALENIVIPKDVH